jgi:hypothetical protein
MHPGRALSAFGRYQLDVVQYPSFVKESLLGTLEPEDRKLALARNCLDPVAALLWLVRTEHDVSF